MALSNCQTELAFQVTCGCTWHRGIEEAGFLVMASSGIPTGWLDSFMKENGHKMSLKLRTQKPNLNTEVRNCHMESDEF